MKIGFEARYLNTLCFLLAMVLIFTKILPRTVTNIPTQEATVPPFVLVLCRGSSAPHVVSGVSPEEMQRRQVEVLLKSAAALTRTKLKFFLVCGDPELFLQVKSFVREWPPHYRSRLELRYRPVYAPTGNTGILQLYDKCSAERLFLPWILPDTESVVFLDTDIFFMRPPEDLLEYFHQFNTTHIFGMAEQDGYYLQSNIDLPFPPPKGIISSLLVANLTRWRALPWDWSSTVAAIHGHFKNRLKTGDQDIFNVILSEHPEALHRLSCSWVGFMEQCLSTNWWCDDVELFGFSAVHGARWRFFRDEIFSYTQFTLPLRVMFRAWEQHQLGAPVASLLHDVLRVLHRLQSDNKLHPNTTFREYNFEKVFTQLKMFVDTYEVDTRLII